jgi:hypothetical protein
MNLLLNLYLFVLHYNEKGRKYMEINTELNKQTLPYMSLNRNKTGYDYRNDIIEELNLTVLESIKKYQILQKLQSNSISIFDKMVIIEKMNKENNYGSNILNGGLFDSWNENF